MQPLDKDALEMARQDIHGSDVEEMVRRECALSDACTLLELLLQFPSQTLVDGIRDGRMALDALDLASDLGASPDETGELESLLDALAQRLASDAASSHEWQDPEARGAAKLHPFLRDARLEYTRLFNQPGNPPIPLSEGPFIDKLQAEAAGSPYFARLFVNPAALDASRQYHRAGLAKPEGTNTPDDGITTELEFLADLHARRARAIANATSEGEGDRLPAAECPSELSAWIDEFRALHCDKWFGAFFGQCAQKSAHELFRFVAAFGELVVKREREAASAR